MTIVGIGTDIIEIDRIRNAVEKNERILGRLFTSAELDDYCLRGCRMEVLAGKFAAKEAVVKAMGTGLRGFAWTDMQILPDDKGKPGLTLFGNAEIIARQNGIHSAFVTLSHHRTSAVAFVIALGSGESL